MLRTVASRARSRAAAASRFYCAARELSAEEQRLAAKLRDALQAKSVDVVDISGGCGASFQVSVESALFKGKGMVQQHRMVTEALKDDMKALHALRIQTSVPR